MARRSRTRSRQLVHRAGAVVGAIALTALLTGCTNAQATDIQGLMAKDASTGQLYFTNRDCGFSSRLSGTNASGQSVTRDVWLFCDSGGWNATTGKAFLGPFFATNTASVVAPSTDPNVTLPALPSATVASSDPTTPAQFQQFIPNTGYPSIGTDCGGNSKYYAAKWPTGAMRIPDSSGRYEYLAVFYQNVCSSFDPSTPYVLLDGGLATFTWDAYSPDAAPAAVVQNDHLFAPGRWHNYWLNTDGNAGFTYGQAPILSAIANTTSSYLAVMQCGPASGCTQARTTLNSTDAFSVSATKLKTRSNWTYRSDGPTTGDADDVWTSVLPSGSCTPTDAANCPGTLPLAKAVIRATTDPSTQVWGSPSVINGGGTNYVGFQPGPTTSGTLNTDRATVEMTDANGIFSTRSSAIMPASHCDPVATKGCYAFVAHPELNSGNHIVFSYVAQHDQPVPNQSPITSMRLAYVCAAQFSGGTC